MTQGSRPGRTFGESIGGILEMDSSDWSSGIRHHVFVTRSDTEFELSWKVNECKPLLCGVRVPPEVVALEVARGHVTAPLVRRCRLTLSNPR